MPEFLNRLIALFSEAVEYITISLIIAGAGFIVSSEWRKSKGYFFAAILFGTALGVATNRIPFLSDYDFLISIIGTITGPPTLALLQRKTLLDLYTLLKKENDNEDKQD